MQKNINIFLLLFLRRQHAGRSAPAQI